MESPSEFSAMGPRTPCPHPMHLRMLLHQRAESHEADSVREHLDQCEVCRATMENLEDEDTVQNTLAEHDAAPVHQVTHSREEREMAAESLAQDNVPMTLADQDAASVRHAPRSREGKDKAGSQARDNVPMTLADQDAASLRQSTRSPDGREGQRGKTGAAAEPTIQITVKSRRKADDREDDFKLSDPIREADRGQTPDPTMTCEFVRGADPSQIDSSGRAPMPTLFDSDRGLLSSPATLENVTVPGYDILEELGRGGMGVVYKARHRRLQRLVALKMVLAGAHVGAVGLARFRAEAEAVAKLSHANIVQIYETGEHEGRPFFSLELVEGGSLDQRIAESPTSPRAAAQLIETLARTMHVAHERGIIHRDLKPANILLAKLGSQSSIVKSREVDSHSLPADHWSRSTVPKIADFGLAKQVDDDSSQTKSGTIWAPPVTWRLNRRGARTGKSARAPTSIRSVRSCTSCWWAVRRSRPAIRSTRSAR